MNARDLVSGSVVAVTADEPVSRAAALMAAEDIGLVPVVDSPETMHLVGVLTDRDIAIRHVAHHDATDCTVGDHMTRAPLRTVRADDHVHDVMGRMRHYQLRRMPVVDENHRLVGVVSQADIALQVAGDEPREFERMMEGISAHAAVPV
jgi:CBS domain-containing protein